MHFFNGAGCENRTRDLNLEGSSFTTKLTPRWHPGKVSNLQPLVLETSALPIELPRYIIYRIRDILHAISHIRDMVRLERFELPTFSFED